MELVLKPHDDENVVKAVAKKRRTKVEHIEPRPEDFPTRVQTPWKIGAHVSAAGGVENAIVNAAKLGATAFALFLKSQRKWTGPPLKAESISLFRKRLEAFGYAPSDVLPHGNYLVNLGNPDEEKREKSYECFVDELKRCEQLGLVYYNFHPGSTVGLASVEDSLAHVANCINRAHKETERIVIVIENMAGAGNVIGGKFEELAAIIFGVEIKSRVGVCLDTCHMFAAGYDIRTEEVQQFDTIVGLKYLREMHLNDSKTPCGSKKDRHDNLGMGQLGLPAFAHIVTDKRTQGIPLIIETPSHDVEDIWRAEIATLHALAADGGQAQTLEDGGAAVREAVKAAGKLSGKARKKRTRAVDSDAEDEFD
ncbi:AP endonuclease [Artomyces pyxidatus]|uniref:AP endonuclease n=1 Tax=Artomyces pyxidatus TaxID=48021 RepID=A0ACB8T6W8_9AGAM|nr:AP endonuclease [Artomyces pyxidatus]